MYRTPVNAASSHLGGVPRTGVTTTGVGLGGGLLGAVWATAPLRLLITSNFFLRAASRVRMLPTTDFCQHQTTTERGVWAHA